MDEKASDKYLGVSGGPTIQRTDRDSRWINGMAERKPLADSPQQILPNAMMEELGVPKKEIDNLKARSVMADWPTLR